MKGVGTMDGCGRQDARRFQTRASASEDWSRQRLTRRRHLYLGDRGYLFVKRVGSPHRLRTQEIALLVDDHQVTATINPDTGSQEWSVNDQTLGPFSGGAQLLR